jgi:hypothetical protein
MASTPRPHPRLRPSIPLGGLVLALLLGAGLHAAAAEVLDPAAVTDPWYRSIVSETLALKPQRLLLEPSADANLDHLIFGTVDGKASSTGVAVTGQPFAHALRIVTEKKDQEWKTLLQWWSPADGLKKGEVVYVTASVRFLKARDGKGQGTGRLYASRERGAGQSAGSENLFGADFAIRPGWHRVHLPMTVAHDFAPGESFKLMFTFGHADQEIEFGGLCALVFPPGTPKEALPHDLPDLAYPGRAPDAPWRAAAAKRIERLRMGDLAVTVVDAAGRPVAGATVAAQMTRHAFKFGTSAPMLIAPGTAIKPWNDDFARVINAPAALKAKALEAFTRHFNAGTAGLTWAIWDGGDPRITRDDCLALARWMKSVGSALDHVQVVYPGPEFLSPKAANLLRKDQAAAFAAAIKAHIFEQCAALAPYGHAAFQIANELEGRPAYTEVLGKPAVLDWFRWADEARRASNPGLKLMTNFPTSPTLAGTPQRAEAEFAAWLAGTSPPTGDWNYEFASWLKKNVPIDYIGFQNHVGIGWAGPEALLKGLDWYATTGLPIEITEFEVVIQDGADAAQRAYQADYVRDFYTAVFSHPAAQGITTQDYWQLNAWQFEGASCFWNKDMVLQPHGQAYLDLVEKAWWTDASGASDANGVYQVRGFQGRYRVTASSGRRTATVETELPRAGTAIRIALP